MSLLKCPKTQIQQFIHQFEDACDNFRKNVPANIYSKIIYTDTKAKLTGIKILFNFTKRLAFLCKYSII